MSDSEILGTESDVEAAAELAGRIVLGADALFRSLGLPDNDAECFRPLEPAFEEALYERVGFGDEEDTSYGLEVISLDPKQD